MPQNVTVESPSVVVQQIRFALDQLGDTNGHFVFEQLCFVFARRRITINLLPATGPVAAGGDQGRDAESFWSELGNAEGGRTATFSSERVVLACTTQKESVPSKIRSDLTKIVAQGSAISRVSYFSVASVPVATRHELQAEAKEDYGIDLEIFDGVGLSEHFAEPDLFWAASEYLRLPASLAPLQSPTTTEDLPSWYVRDRRLLRQSDGVEEISYGRFVTVRDLADYATFHTAARADLVEWIPRLQPFVVQRDDPGIRMRARYSIAVSSLRGMGNLRPVDSLVVDFFVELLGIDDDTSLLQDAVTLLNYVYGCWLRRNTGLQLDELDAWHARLEALLIAQLAEVETKNGAAAIREMIVRLRFFPLLSATSGEHIPAITAEESLAELTELETTAPVRSLTDAFALRDIRGGMAVLEDLIDGLTEVPAFPIGPIAQSFDLLSVTLSVDARYLSIRNGLDEAVGRVEGDEAQARRAQVRAEGFLESGHVLRALDEVHTAKLRLWHGDTLGRSIEMMHLASDLYANLNLFAASKQLALLASAVALNSHSLELSAGSWESVGKAALADYHGGNWISAFHLSAVAVAQHREYAEHPLHPDEHATLKTMMEANSIIMGAAADFAPSYLPVMASAYLDAEEIVQSAASTSRPDGWSRQGILDMIAAAGMGEPFSDAGPVRSYQWLYAGFAWKVTCGSEHDEVLATERLVAALQILQADLFEAGIVWSPGNVSIGIAMAAPESTQLAAAEQLTWDDTGTTWSMVIPRQEEASPIESIASLSATLFDVLRRNSLTRPAEFQEAAEKAIKRGLISKLSSGRPYSEIADLISIETYDAAAGLSPTPLNLEDASGNRPPTEVSSPSLRPDDYNRDEVLSIITSRYENAMRMVRYTLPRLLAHAQTKKILTEYHEQGWPDWQIVTMLVNIVANYRVSMSKHPLGPNPTQAELSRAAALMREQEAESEVVPLSQFTKESFERYAAMLPGTLIGSFGLALNAQISSDLLRKFLNRYFGFSRDDVQHGDIFGWDE